eukprot:2452147-Rhodomonas_salina.1
MGTVRHRGREKAKIALQKLEASPQKLWGGITAKERSTCDCGRGLVACGEAAEGWRREEVRGQRRESEERGASGWGGGSGEETRCTCVSEAARSYSGQRGGGGDVHTKRMRATAASQVRPRVAGALASSSS